MDEAVRGTVEVLGDLMASELADERTPKVLWDTICAVLVSLALTLDWLPAYVTGSTSSIVSLTRWVAAPLMLLSMVIEPGAYLPVLARPQVIVLGLATVAGIGGGVAVGAVPVSTLVSFMPNLLVIVFYARKRDGMRLRGILVSLVLGAWLLCGAIVLVGLGIGRAGLTVTITDVGGGAFERAWAGVSMTLLGPWVALLVASVGGLDLRDWRSVLLVPLAVGVSAFVAMVTAQRSILVAGVLSLAMGAIGIVATARQRVVSSSGRRHVGRNAVLILSCVVLAFVAFWPTVSERSFTLRYRLTATTKTTQVFSDAFRLAFWRYFAHDLVSRPQVIPPGDQAMVANLGMGPHMMLGECYYYGGLLMLVAMFMLMGSSVMSVFWAAWHWQSDGTAIVARVVLSALVPSLLYLLIMPGFVTRLPYVLMGLALSFSSARLGVATTNR